ncbi:hypothetical protein ACWEOI_14980 [Nocardia sp. NPDC004340]
MAALNVMLNTLRLVYPPVSNQEAEWVKSDPAVAERLRRSDFYMIGARAEARFTEFSGDDVSGQLRVRIDAGEDLHDEVVLDIILMAMLSLGRVPEDLSVRFDAKVIKVYAASSEQIDTEDPEPFEWFTTEKLIWDRSHHKQGIYGFDRFHEFGTYELLYVGIAKRTNTFERLFAGAHATRQRILSNEYQRRPGARVTDELVLFAFEVAPLVMRDWTEGSALITDTEWSVMRKAVVADAEKAFVHLLDPRYNVEKFANYPRGEDGLYSSGFDRYGFVLIENLSFRTGEHVFRGAGVPSMGQARNDADMLSICGDVVELRRGLEAS